ncbi:MAG: NAD(P)H-dependent oxidoreductase subunit E [candidate division Zixibacteria bacterium]|nr:NAD(P)H-dependent oxidoreductase subunit E [candidate division Zixibacteria bacterium]
MINSSFAGLFTEFQGEEGELIPILQRIQEVFGYISEDAVRNIAPFLRISENQIFGVASFYSQFKFVEPGKCTIKVCMGTACHVRGSLSILDEFRRWLHIEPGKTTDDRMFTLETVNCLGACALGPIVAVDTDYHGLMKIKEVEGLIQKYGSKDEREGDAVI